MAGDVPKCYRCGNYMYGPMHACASSYFPMFGLPFAQPSIQQERKMFEGSTTITMNEATLIKAVQEYLDKRIAPDVEKNVVKSVKANSGGYGDSGFKVELSDQPVSQ